MIEQWQGSGITQKAFCEQQSLRYHTFYYWYKCYRRREAGSDDNIPSFVKLKIEKPAKVGSIEIHYPGGGRLTFREPVTTAEKPFINFGFPTLKLLLRNRR